MVERTDQAIMKTCTNPILVNGKMIDDAASALRSGKTRVKNIRESSLITSTMEEVS